jgi:hypothetical protein
MSSQPKSPEDLEKRKLNVVRFGLLVIPLVAWALSFSLPFVVTPAGGPGWLAAGVSAALLPSLIVLVVTGIISIVVYQVYKRLVVHK